MLLRIQILSTGDFLYLSDKALTVDINSNLFQAADEFTGSFSYTGTAPWEPNAAILQNARLITTSVQLRTFMVRVWLGSLPWKIARLNYTMEGLTINYVLYFDNSIIANKLKTLRLQDLYLFDSDYKSFNNTAEYKAYLMDTVTAAPGKYPHYFFPFKNDAAYKTIDPDNYADYPDIAFPVNTYINDWAIDEEGNGDFVIDDYSLPVKQTQMPFYNLSYLCKRIAKFFGLNPVGSWLDEENTLRTCVYSNIVNYAPLIIADIASGLPNVLVSEFLKDAAKRFGLLILPDQLSGNMYFESIANLVNSVDEIDLRERQIDASYQEISTDLESYTIAESVDANDSAFTDEDKAAMPVLKVGDFVEGATVTDIKLSSVSTKMIIEVSPASATGSNWRVPYIKQPIYGIPPLDQISTLPYDQERVFAIRYLYYHGLQKNDAGFLYPYGSSDNLNLNLKPISKFSLALNADGDTLSATKRYFEFRKNSKPFEISLELTVNEYFRITPRSRLVFRDFNQATVRALLDKITADLVDGDFITVKASVWPILIPVNTAQVDTAPPTGTVPPFDNGTVYVKLQFRNIRVVESNLPPPPYRAVIQDIWLMFFEDAAMTTPKNVTNLTVNIKQNTATSSNPSGENSILSYVCDTTANELLVYPGAVSSSTQYYSQSYRYTLINNSEYHVIT